MMLIECLKFSPWKLVNLLDEADFLEGQCVVGWGRGADPSLPGLFADEVLKLLPTHSP